MKGVAEIAKAVGIWALVVLLSFGLGAVALAVWAWLVFAGAETRAAKAAASLRTTLMPEEQLIEQAVQHRAFALFSRRALAAITSSRILVMRRGLLGGFRMADIQWKDLKDATIEQNVLDGLCGSNLKFLHLNPGAPPIGVDGVPSAVASQMYSRAQAEEQAWEEKRRVRGIEETRAASGGVYVNTPHGAGAATAAPAGSRVLAEIEKAKALLDAGVITDAEFQEMKAKILAGS